MGTCATAAGTYILQSLDWLGAKRVPIFHRQRTYYSNCALYVTNVRQIKVQLKELNSFKDGVEVDVVPVECWC